MHKKKTYFGFQIYGPRRDQTEIDNKAKMTIFQKTNLMYNYIWDHILGPKLTIKLKRPYMRRPYKQNRVYLQVYIFLQLKSKGQRSGSVCHTSLMDIWKEKIRIFTQSQLFTQTSPILCWKTLRTKPWKPSIAMSFHTRVTGLSISKNIRIRLKGLWTSWSCKPAWNINFRLFSKSPYICKVSSLERSIFKTWTYQAGASVHYILFIKSGRKATVGGEERESQRTRRV